VVFCRASSRRIPLVELVENRDYPGSSHFFFDIGNRNLLG
jgi:glyoxylase I family protein